MMKNNQRNAKTASRRKAFLRILSLTVTLLLAISMVIMPVSAATPEAGYTSGKYVIYAATDARSATDVLVSSKDSVWKFAVGGLSDTFKTSSADFAAPEAEAVGNGAIKLSWNVPEGTQGITALKVIGTNYNKDIVVAGNTVTLNDTKLSDTYQVQVTVGNISSKILTYNNIYSPITTKNLNNNTGVINVDRDENQDGIVENQWGFTIFDVSDYTDLIGDNAAFIFKIESVIEEENTFNVTQYRYQDTRASINEWRDFEESEYINSADSGIAFDAYIGAKETNVSDNSVQQFAANADATRTVYRLDTSGMGVRTDIKSTAITKGSNMKGNFSNGYIIVPFDVVGEEGIEFIKEYGIFSLTTEAFRYYTNNHNYYSANVPNGKWQSTDAVSYERTDITDATGVINQMLDRDVVLSEAGFISDFDAFEKYCVDKNVETAGVTYSNLSKISEAKDAVYLQPVADTTYTLAADGVTSTYTSNATNYTYTTAAGEKMELGFTAPQAGTYEISAPIIATVTSGVHYRVVKETADGVKTIVQVEKTYAGEKHMALMNVTLAQGDTLYLEAWADTAGTVIDLGDPNAILLDKAINTETGVITYSSESYLEAEGINNNSLQDSARTWQLGYFINPITVTTKTDETDTSTTHDYINYATKETYDAADNITLGLDTLGIADLDVDDDATALVNALSPYEGERGNVYQAAINRYNSGGSPKHFANNYDGYGITMAKISISNGTITHMEGFGHSFAGMTKINTSNKALNGRWSNTGSYQQFTAPVTGVATLALGENQSTNGGKVLVIINNKVLKNYEGDAITDSSIDLGTLNKGDVVSIVWGKYIKNSETGKSFENTSVTTTAPVIELTPAATTESSVGFDGEIPVLMNDKYTNGTEITLPTTAKNGAIFTGWKANDEAGTVYNAGEKYIVNADVKFEAQYIYYGDLDGKDGAYQGTDISILRKMLIKVAEAGGDDNAEKTGDIDANGEIDIIDLIKMKKMSVGIDTTVGAK